MAFSAFLSGVLADRDPVRDALVVRRGDDAAGHDRPGDRAGPDAGGLGDPRSSRRRPGSPTRGSRSGRDARPSAADRRPVAEIVARQQPADHRAGHRPRRRPCSWRRRGSGRTGKAGSSGPVPRGSYFVPRQMLTVRCSLRRQLIGTLRQGRSRDAGSSRGPGEGRARGDGADDWADSTPTCRAPVPSRRPSSGCSSSPGSCWRLPDSSFIDRMGGELNRAQLATIYGLLKQSSITYLTIGDRSTLLPYHDQELEVQGEGRWRTGPARDVNAVGGLTAPP